MLELVGGDTPLSKGKFFDKSMEEKSLGLDFANLLQEAQFEQEAHRYSRSCGFAEHGPERPERSEEDSSLHEEGEDALEKKKVPEEENAGTPSGVTRVDRPSEDQQESEDEVRQAEDKIQKLTDKGVWKITDPLFPKQIGFV